jgi:D-alanine transaminase
MTRIVYVNGDYVPEDQAKVSVFDRGFLFADGVWRPPSRWTNFWTSTEN